MGGDETCISFHVKWRGKQIEMSASMDGTVLDLKEAIKNLTDIPTERQKILNLFEKDTGNGTSGKKRKILANDKTMLENTNFSAGLTLTLMGTPAQEIQTLLKEEEKGKELASTIKDDDDGDIEDDFHEPVHQREVNKGKLEKRISSYTWTFLNPPRQDKKLLVLDIDYTIFDHRTPAESARELMRPYLHEFLASVYRHYDLVIWSATSLKWIQLKMEELGVIAPGQSANSSSSQRLTLAPLAPAQDAAPPETQEKAWKIMALMDSRAMISVADSTGRIHNCKPLKVLWSQAVVSQVYGPHNTIMFDDIKRNFLMNPQSGLQIRPFKHAHRNRSDDELMRLEVYLNRIATDQVDFRTLNHDSWEEYCKRD